MLGKSRLLDAPERLISDVICRHWCFSSCTLLHTLPDDPATAAQVALSSVDLLSWSRRISRLSLLPLWCSHDRSLHLPTPALVLWWALSKCHSTISSINKMFLFPRQWVVASGWWWQYAGGASAACLVPLRGVWVGSWFLRFLAAAPQPSQRKAGSSAAADSHSDGFSSGLD